MLPVEVLSIVGSFLPYEHYKNLALVSKAVRDGLKTYASSPYKLTKQQEKTFNDLVLNKENVIHYVGIPGSGADVVLINYLYLHSRNKKNQIAVLVDTKYEKWYRILKKIFGRPLSCTCFVGGSSVGWINLTLFKVTSSYFSFLKDDYTLTISALTQKYYKLMTTLSDPRRSLSIISHDNIGERCLFDMFYEKSQDKLNIVPCIGKRSRLPFPDYPQRCLCAKNFLDMINKTLTLHKKFTVVTQSETVNNIINELNYPTFCSDKRKEFEVSELGILFYTSKDYIPSVSGVVVVHTLDGYHFDSLCYQNTTILFFYPIILMFYTIIVKWV